MKYSHSAHDPCHAGASGIGWKRSTCRSAAAGDRAVHAASAVVSVHASMPPSPDRRAPAPGSGCRRARPHAHAHRRRTGTGPPRGRGPPPARAPRSASACSVPVRSSDAGVSRPIATTTSPPPTSCGDWACCSTTSATPSRMAITATPAPKPTASTRAADGMRGQRAQRQTSDHRVRSLSTRPSRRVTMRRARDASVVVVRDDDQGRAVQVHAIQQLGHVLARGLVQLAGGLVGQQQARLVGQCTRDRHALHLAARELRRPMVCPRGQPHVVQQLARPGLTVARARTPASDCGSSTFSAAVSIGSRKKRWNTKPIGPQPQQAALAIRQRGHVASLEEQRARGRRVHAARACAAAWTCRSPTGRAPPR